MKREQRGSRLNATTSVTTMEDRTERLMRETERLLMELDEDLRWRGTGTEARPHIHTLVGWIRCETNTR